MSITKSLILSVAGLAALMTVASAPVIAHADTTTAGTCTVTAAGVKNTANNNDSRFILSGNTVIAGFIVSGTDCSATITLASWQAPNAGKGQPYSEQTLFNHSTGTFSPSKEVQIMTVTIPDCYFQVDLVRGASATGSDGSAVYDKTAMIGSLHGGTQACTPVTPPNPPTPPTPPVLPPTLPKTGSGLNVFLLGSLAAFAGYAVNLVRKARA